MLPNIRTKIPGPKSEKMLKRGSNFDAYINLENSFSIVLNKAFDSCISDVDGNIFLDMSSCFGVNVFGHSNQDIIKQIKKQIENLSHGLGSLHISDKRLEFSEIIINKIIKNETHDSYKVMFASGGSEAIEIALKLVDSLFCRNDFAAVIFEPIQNLNGYIIPPYNFF